MSGCDGPSGEAWSPPHNACVASPSQVSCDSVNQSTCHYAYVENLDKVEWFSGKFLAGHGLKVEEPAGLASIGIGPGDWIDQINGVVLTDEATMQGILDTFTPSSPATIFTATHLLGKFQLTLAH